MVNKADANGTFYLTLTADADGTIRLHVDEDAAKNRFQVLFFLLSRSSLHSIPKPFICAPAGAFGRPGLAFSLARHAREAL